MAVNRRIRTVIAKLADERPVVHSKIFEACYLAPGRVTALTPR